MTYSIPIPNDATNVGVQIFAQGTVVAPGSNRLGILASDRATLTIGRDPALVAIVEGGSSGAGNPAAGGYFRLEYPGDIGGSLPRIVRAEWDLTTVTSGRLDFDTDGLTGPRQFHHGNGQATGCGNAFYGTDRVTGLIYGGPGQQTSGCDPNGHTGWTGSNPGIGIGYFATLTFRFTGFEVSDVFAFDCDTDFPFPNDATSHAGATVTVEFEDGTTVSGQFGQIPNTRRLEAILIP